MKLSIERYKRLKIYSLNEIDYLGIVGCKGNRHILNGEFISRKVACIILKQMRKQIQTEKQIAEYLGLF